jgi:hypothetical protein
MGYMIWRYSYLIEYGISASGMVYKFLKPPKKLETDLEEDWILLTKKSPPVIVEEY